MTEVDPWNRFSMTMRVVRCSHDQDCLQDLWRHTEDGRADLIESVADLRCQILRDFDILRDLIPQTTESRTERCAGDESIERP